MNFGRFFGHFQMYSKSRLLTLRTWSLARNIWGNTNERKVKRNKIVSELKKGFIPDLKEIKENGGKRYNALEKPFPKEESITLPTITGVTLSGESLELPKDIIGFVVLILLWTRDHGQRACDTYRSVFQKNFHTSDVRCYEVNLLDRWIFKMMKSYIITNLQKQLPLDRQQNFYVAMMELPR
ncbi:uncharacterized protein LOC124444261 isoform X1 [Xenia sp. Carnegie-2017]|uniref:uncharacterized protein LOC124444261 isoform X1 n=1 Tax=Xenia sp. Carnegie-2017 TaxID=2897299 RepID=UPI001F045C23|nr:uncharacterized protein LOC124444261 isoform X1 [Xenia sp. Carnegie-2017]